MVKNLFFDEKTGKYYFIGDSSCYDCGKVLDRSIYFFMSLGKEKSFIHEFCLKCAAKNKSALGMITSSFIAVVVDKPPMSSRPIVLKAPEFTNKANCFEAATPEFDNKIFSNAAEGYKIIDHTLLAGRESWQGATIGAPMKEPEITANDALKLLEHEIKKSKKK